MNDPHDRRLRRSAVARMALRVVAVAAIIWCVHWIMGHVMPEDAAAGALGDDMMPGLLIATLAAYTILIAIPFVPGVEIGASLLIFGGPAVAPFVYLATLIGLLLAYGCGRLIPYAWLHQVFADLHMARMCQVLEDMAPLTRQERLDALRRRAPAWAQVITVRGRYPLLALLLVLPGNAVIGGGGGICLLAGLSRLYATLPTALTIGLAVLPIPLGVWLFDLKVWPGL